MDTEETAQAHLRQHPLTGAASVGQEWRLRAVEGGPIVASFLVKLGQPKQEFRPPDPTAAVVTAREWEDGRNGRACGNRMTPRLRPPSPQRRRRKLISLSSASQATATQSTCATRRRQARDRVRPSLAPPPPTPIHCPHRHPPPRHSSWPASPYRCYAASPAATRAHRRTGLISRRSAVGVARVMATSCATCRRRQPLGKKCCRCSRSPPRSTSCGCATFTPSATPTGSISTPRRRRRCQKEGGMARPSGGCGMVRVAAKFRSS